MAGSNHDARDKFDMRQPEETWGNFLAMAGWITAGCVVLLVLMALFLTGSHNVLR